MTWPNKAPAPNRRLGFRLGGLGEFEYHICAPPAIPAAVCEARRQTFVSRWELLLFASLLLSGCASRVVQYPTHHEPVIASEVPGDILKTFHQSCPQAKIVNVTKVTGGETGTALIFYAFRFTQEGRLREALIHRPGDTAPFIYDIRD